MVQRLRLVSTESFGARTWRGCSGHSRRGSAR
jgi:hypothetical protein